MEKNIFDLAPVVDRLVRSLPVGLMTPYTQDDFNTAVYDCEQLARIYSAMRDKLFDDFVRETVEPPVVE